MAAEAKRYPDFTETDELTMTGSPRLLPCYILNSFNIYKSFHYP